MATCEKKSATPIPPPVEYVLTLNEKEARLLRRLLFSHVAGSGAQPLWDINAALTCAGVKAADIKAHVGVRSSVLQFDEMIARD
jgi:hypothetical protein